MSENASAELEKALSNGNRELQVSDETHEKNLEPYAEHAASNDGEDTMEDPGLPANPQLPSGKFKSWLFALATFFMFISAWGLTQAFGIFQEIYLTMLLPGSSSSSISWIGSVQTFLVIVLGSFTGPLFDAGYLRILLLLGCSLIVLGMATLSLANTYWQVFLAQALCVGIGSGLIYVPSLALVATLFQLVSAGSFFGRTVPMLIAGRLGAMQIYVAASMSAIVVLFAWTAVYTSAGLVVFSVMYGLVSGILVSGPSAAIPHPVLAPSMDVIGTRLGMTWMFGGVGVLVGSPIAGALVDVSRADFTKGQVFAGAMTTAGSLCLIVPLIAVLRYDKKARTG